MKYYLDIFLTAVTFALRAVIYFHNLAYGLGRYQKGLWRLSLSGQPTTHLQGHFFTALYKRVKTKNVENGSDLPKTSSRLRALSLYLNRASFAQLAREIFSNSGIIFTHCARYRYRDTAACKYLAI
jgi:hypothetical protein